jgi:hypothetical protein
MWPKFKGAKMSATSTQPALSDENISVERVLDDAIELRIQHGLDQCSGTLNKSDVVALAKKLNVNADDLIADEEDDVVDAMRFFAVGVMCCLVFGGLVGIFSN